MGRAGQRRDAFEFLICNDMALAHDLAQDLDRGYTDLYIGLLAKNLTEEASALLKL